ncbi:MAG: UDP-N-acetylmuramoyl-tripeptide--D-alanyl-D-alanine ligase, partial [Candidatus Omnitrophota bacterium]
MFELTVREIADVTGGKLKTGDESAVVKGLSIDTRSIRPGEIFIALKGQNFDGHDYIEEAVKKGASGLIVERETGSFREENVEHIIVVKDSREAMGEIAAWIRKKVDIPVVCVTGTNGKTTFKEILSYLLSPRYKVLKSRKSYNNIVGLSLTLFGLDRSYDIAVLELGTNRPGEISQLAGIAKPTTCVITNIGNGHLEFLGDREGVLAEKVSILRHLSGSGVTYLNGDDAHLKEAGRGNPKVKFFGTSSDCDFRINQKEKKENGYGFTLNRKKYFIPLQGEHNIYNAAAAAAVAGDLGVSREEIEKKLEALALPEMRLEKVDVGGVMFINDSYNANPSSFECALNVLKEMPARGKKGVVAGEMLELGKGSARFHQDLGKSIAGKKIDFLITVGEMAGNIARG